MIDRDLAIVYGVGTKVLNQAVKRNIDRFPEEFRFQLTDKEKSELVTNCDRFRSLKDSSVNPYVFTEQGASMKELGRKWIAFSSFESGEVEILNNY